ncbi:LacI family DNA-binding transcriptional regulator [Trinickia caryophylli]|uniref:Transcriptional regulator, LacI family n=1 Tax=Trinickia caryophylli TaxID=28094 RepID=A0A1X7ELU4_TRICW|nr:LacI family DNA-binding transcriptional regulator [Trinickia caryophylli]PMS08863.1 LacI family transcriptional regulator [Trinickia caryophylli]TRX18783.1 LacI family transcriptional regulator [Trinickia caryophylli]WQE10420.1 LacI family DNA-binding transcriptional regulator [Trinickia caryophylli]SMF36082.1 transcriptional regulator, LacI family [Trinickia caryophylli]
MTTTIRDIARAANVSIGTVSRALKNQPGLSEATRTRVVETARRLGYDAAQLRPRVRRLTFVLHRQHNNFAVSPFFSHVLHGVENACRARGIVPSLLTAGPTEDIAEQLRLHLPDAIAVAGFIEPETLAAIGAMGRPLVLIDLWAPGLRSVNLDNGAGAALAMRHLFSMNRTRVAFIGGSLAHYSIAQRALGYRRAFFEAGLLFDPSLETICDASLPAAAGAALAMQRLLDAHSRTPLGLPNAVFASNDVTALAAMQVCLARGLRVPEDIAFVGFDDIPAAAHASPSLTTIAADKEALGARGVELLLDDSPPGYEVLLPVELVARASTIGAGAPPARSTADVPSETTP